MSVIREEEANLRATLAGSLDSPGINAVRKLGELELQRIMARMIDADPEQIMVMQGQARGVRDMLKYLKG